MIHFSGYYHTRQEWTCSNHQVVVLKDTERSLHHRQGGVEKRKISSWSPCTKEQLIWSSLPLLGYRCLFLFSCCSTLVDIWEISQEDIQNVGETKMGQNFGFCNACLLIWWKTIMVGWEILRCEWNMIFLLY